MTVEGPASCFSIAWDGGERKSAEVDFNWWLHSSATLVAVVVAGIRLATLGPRANSPTNYPFFQLVDHPRFSVRDSLSGNISAAVSCPDHEAVRHEVKGWARREVVVGEWRETRWWT